MRYITFKCMFIVILNILPIICKISTRSYKNGAQKRKNKQRVEEVLNIFLHGCYNNKFNAVLYVNMVFALNKIEHSDKFYSDIRLKAKSLKT